jgi:putative ubiquitin-RnfH superfamily antitoxin RatB of RatAB toxin-antitoxin module
MADTVDPQSMLHIQVCYALRDRQVVLDATVKNGATIHDAIAASGILGIVETIDLTSLRVGIYGKLKDLESPVGDRDRIEIYRPLTADPMESRRRRAAKRSGK